MFRAKKIQNALGHRGTTSPLTSCHFLLGITYFSPPLPHHPVTLSTPPSALESWTNSTLKDVGACGWHGIGGCSGVDEGAQQWPSAACRKQQRVLNQSEEGCGRHLSVTVPDPLCNASTVPFCALTISSSSFFHTMIIHYLVIADNQE